MGGPAGKKKPAARGGKQVDTYYDVDEEEDEEEDDDDEDEKTGRAARASGDDSSTDDSDDSSGSESGSSSVSALTFARTATFAEIALSDDRAELQPYLDAINGAAAQPARLLSINTPGVFLPELVPFLPLTERDALRTLLQRKLDGMAALVPVKRGRGRPRKDGSAAPAAPTMTK